MTGYSSQVHAKLLSENLLSLGGEGDGAGAVVVADPALPKAVRTKRRADRASNMRAPLAPIEAGPAQNARGTLAAMRHDAIEVDADLAKERNSYLGHHSSIGGQLDLTAVDQSICKRHAEAAGKMVVTGPCRSQCRIPRTDDESRALATQTGRHLHNAFHHLGHRRRGEPVVAMPALLLDR